MTRVEYTHASEMGAREFENDRVAHGGPVASMFVTELRPLKELCDPGLFS